MMRKWDLVVAVGLSAALAGASGCGDNRVGGNGNNNGGKPDLVIVFDEPDLGLGESGDLADNSDPSICGDPHQDPSCLSVIVGPPSGQFPLQTDQVKDPAQNEVGVNRDINGWLKLDSSHTVFNYLWIANASDNNSAGSVSKIDSKTVREVARYLTVTCNSLKTGSTAACDGTNGCCTLDDWNRYQARKNKQPEPGHQPVQKGANYPSRTSVDFNGDLFISNRAFGGQSSVTKVSNDPSACVDRNRNGRIDTSADTNGNGFIEEDCNGDGQYDTIAGVQQKPCTNNLKQEFYGEDDECILWTTNTFQNGAIGRPLGLSGGDTNVSDAWAGSYQFGSFVRIDGLSGKCKDDIQLPNSCYGGTGPYGLAVDSSGVGWTMDLGGGKLCYFDTKKPSNVLTGAVRDPQWGQAVGYGITMDRDQNVWIGSGVARYTPDRSNGFNNLGQGWWTRMGGLNGIGIAADSRNAKDYYVWSCQGGTVTQIPASTIKVMKMDQTVNNNGWPTIQMPCYGVGVDSDQNVWGVDMQKSTRALVDMNGKITQPAVNGAPMGNNKCPAGDSCPNAGAYTYSDFTGFGLRNFTRPSGGYSYVVPGCKDMGTGEQVDTQWYSVVWDADVPPNTQLYAHAKASSAATYKDAAWQNAQWTPDAPVSPLSLQGVLVPNLSPDDPNGTVVNDQYLMVEFVFKTSAQNASPKLKNFSVGFKCEKITG